MPFDKLETSKTLGLIWNSNNDVFKFHVTVMEQSKFTKRTVLSSIAQIFDPLGLLGPVITVAKLVMQRLWQLELDWDETLPLAEHTLWIKLQSEFPQINNFSISRKVTTFNEYKIIQIHGFCDASQRAYGACIYVRTTDHKGQHAVQLLCSKSRVAPLKATTLPRLELCSAQLLAHLIKKIRSCLKVPITSEYLWTDSTIVLNWISSPSISWKTFISNRVADIQENTNISNWRHVSTNDNPADLISRGIMPLQLMHNVLWWNGPTWLTENSTSWPSYLPEPDSEIIELERRQIKPLCFVAQTNADRFEIFHKYSSFTKLQRVLAYCLRFITNCLRKKHYSGTLSTEELHNSSICLLKLAQAQTFPEEICELNRSGLVKKNSKILSLSPFIDENGLIRVGGRIQRADISYSHKHPVLLSPTHALTELIIKKEHISLLHAGPQAVLASLRTKYWPLSGRNTVRKITRRCVTCFRHKPSTIYPMMGNLPVLRIKESRAFLNVAVDYAGPVLIKESRRRGRVQTYNCYIAIFVCLCTKAVHIELVAGLTTDDFLAALKRFVSRRGKCAQIFSDNATNFVKANKTLQSLSSLLSSEAHWTQIEIFTASQSIQWHFIPPRSPTFAGLWEAAVKSMKHHIKRVTGNTLFTYEEYYTFLVQTEACLNSRPLTQMSTDPNDFSVLTPGHFLIGDSLQSLPDANYTHAPVTHLSRWNHIQSMLQHLWKRWSVEYLNLLQLKSKWKTPTPNIPEGTLIILKEDNLPPLRWRFGRVTEVFPGDDGVVRVVKVKTSSGEFKRAVNKICVLPIDDNCNLP